MSETKYIILDNKMDLQEFLGLIKHIILHISEAKVQIRKPFNPKVLYF